MTSSARKIAIMLNGPARSGKDTAADALVEVFGDACGIFKFTRPVKDETHRRYGLAVAFDHYEVLKDEPLEEFGGISPRQAYINVGNSLRAEHGPDIVTTMFCAAVEKSDFQIIINPDCGGDGEAEGLAGALGADRVIVFRIHKEGHDYTDDCRDWVRSDLVRKIDIVNVADRMDDYQNTVRHIGRMFRDSYLAADVAETFEAPTPARALRFA